MLRKTIIVALTSLVVALTSGCTSPQTNGDPVASPSSFVAPDFPDFEAHTTANSPGICYTLRSLRALINVTDSEGYVTNEDLVKWKTKYSDECDLTGPFTLLIEAFPVESFGDIGVYRVRHPEYGFGYWIMEVKGSEA